MVKLILWMFDVVAWLIRSLGADYSQFRAILENKLILDTRRRMMMTVHKRKKKPGNAFAGTLVFYGFMGVFIGMSALMAGSPLVGMTIVHAFVMTMLGMSLVADFSSVLLDTTDNAIMQPRPVAGRTILIARMAHIVVYLGSLSLSLSLVTLVTGACRWGVVFVPVYVLTLACAISLVVCAVNLFYLVAIRLTNGERLRDIILYFQMLMSILVVGGYQLLPRLIDLKLVRDLRIDDRWWIYVFPPTWMAAPIDLLAGNVGFPQLILSAMGVVVPILGLAAVVRVLGPRFNRALEVMDAVSASTTAASKTRRGRSSVQSLARLLCGTRVGRSVFEVVWLLCSRDRQFKLRTYPSLVIMFMLPAIWLLSGGQSFREAFTGLSATKKHLLLLYMACASLPTALIQLRYSDNWQAAWVYAAMPIRLPGEVFVAAMKALIVRFVLPAFAIVATVTLTLWGPAALADVALSACITLLMCVVQGLFFSRRFPFSEAFGTTEAHGGMARSFLLMLVLPASLGGLHYLLTFYPLCVPLMIPVVLLTAAMLLRAYAHTPWAAIRQ